MQFLNMGPVKKQSQLKPGVWKNETQLSNLQGGTWEKSNQSVKFHSL